MRRLVVLPVVVLFVAVFLSACVAEVGLTGSGVGVHVGQPTAAPVPTQTPVPDPVVHDNPPGWVVDAHGRYPCDDGEERVYALTWDGLWVTRCGVADE